MPELPELETITTQLDKVLVGKKIKSVEVLRKSSFIGDEKLLKNKKISSVTRRAKMGIIKFQNSDSLLLIHLKMTGQLVFVGDKKRIAGGHPTADFVNNLPSKHTRVIFTFVDDSHLYFNDLRAFGWVKIISQNELKKLIEKLPPDVIDKNFTLSYLSQVLSKSARPVKIIIMDQTKFGGVGNIYVNDALLLAKITPKLPSKQLTEKQVTSLHQAIIKIVKKGIKFGGASYSNYVDVSGAGGKYQEHFLAYKQDGKVCSQCKSATIKKLQLGGRGTYFCPKCQN